jgi:hypothetical protein
VDAHGHREQTVNIAAITVEQGLKRGEGHVLKTLVRAEL